MYTRKNGTCKRDMYNFLCLDKKSAVYIEEIFIQFESRSDKEIQEVLDEMFNAGFIIYPYENYVMVV